MSSAVDIFLVVLIVGLLVILVTGKVPALESLFASLIQDVHNPNSYTVTTYNPQATNFTNGTQGERITTPQINQSTLDSYALTLINNDRAAYGLAPVTLSYEPSAQQHSDSMLYYGYFSHWDPFDMKPYMRYTLVGGNDSVTENIAYETSKICTVLGCTGNIDPQQALQRMEYNMMYNDSVCCNNGHRDNILDPSHNQVSIGIAYNSSYIYFTEDFINDYINWNAGNPAYSDTGEVYMSGQVAQGYHIDQIYVLYDTPVQNMSAQALPSGSYSYGDNVAGVVNSSAYYYPSLQTIVADNYAQRNGQFSISFNIASLIKKYGAGEYTVETLMNDTQTGAGFTGSTYTIFINSQGKQYIPAYV